MPSGEESAVNYGNEMSINIKISYSQLGRRARGARLPGRLAAAAILNAPESTRVPESSRVKKGRTPGPPVGLHWVSGSHPDVLLL